MQSTGLVLAAGGIAAANEVIFAPLAHNAHNPLDAVSTNPLVNFNWRIVPATLILALVLGGFESLSPQAAKLLGGMVIFAVLVTPVGNAPAPIDNLTKVIGG